MTLLAYSLIGAGLLLLLYLTLTSSQAKALPKQYLEPPTAAPVPTTETHFDVQKAQQQAIQQNFKEQYGLTTDIEEFVQELIETNEGLGWLSGALHSYFRRSGIDRTTRTAESYLALAQQIHELKQKAELAPVELAIAIQAKVHQGTLDAATAKANVEEAKLRTVSASAEAGVYAAAQEAGHTRETYEESLRVTLHIDEEEALSRLRIQEKEAEGRIKVDQAAAIHQAKSMTFANLPEIIRSTGDAIKEVYSNEGIPPEQRQRMAAQLEASLASMLDTLFPNDSGD